MKELNSKLFSIVFLSLFSFGRGQMFFAQEPAGTASLTPSADEILAEVALHCKLSPTPDKVLVAGQVATSTLLQRSTLTLTKAMALLGGVSSNGRSSIYLIRLDGGSRSVTEIDLGQIRNGQVKDVLLNGGDLVFVPHILRGTPTYDARRHSVCPNVPLGKPRQFTDDPITPRRSRITAIRLSHSKI